MLPFLTIKILLVKSKMMKQKRQCTSVIKTMRIQSQTETEQFQILCQGTCQITKFSRELTL